MYYLFSWLTWEGSVNLGAAAVGARCNKTPRQEFEIDKAF